MATPDTVAATPDSLRWGPCPKKAESRNADASRLECATLDVPLDYRDPDGRQIQIAVSRLASKVPSKRRGVLLTNPGGPGGSGLDYPALLAGAGLPKDVLDSYDVIGFDPRGVGRSTPVTCDLTPQQQARGNFPPYAHTAADVAKEAPYARIIAERCATSRTAWMLPYTTTANTARDMDRIRAALGEPKASYVGASYGSYLGAVYTTLFPGRSDRIVLDSNMGPGGYDLANFRLLGRGMEDRFPDFAAYAAAHPVLSRTIGFLSLCVLVTALALLVPQLAEQLTKSEAIAQHTGTFTSPIDLPKWGNIAIGLATLAASTERALRLRHSHLLDGAAG